MTTTRFVRLGIVVTSLAGCSSRDGSPPDDSPEEDLWAEVACVESDEPIEVYTDPGRAVFVMRSLANAEYADRFPQDPAAGTPLEPGIHRVSVTAVDGDLTCSRDVLVTVNPDEPGLLPDVEYVPAAIGDGDAVVGAVPSLSVGPLIDEIGGAITLDVYVDDTLITGTDLSAVTSIFDAPGVHVVDLVSRDQFGRTALQTFAELYELPVSFVRPFVKQPYDEMGMKPNCNCFVKSDPRIGNAKATASTASCSGDEDQSMEDSNTWTLKYECFIWEDTNESSSMSVATATQCAAREPARPTIVVYATTQLGAISAYSGGEDDSALGEASARISLDEVGVFEVFSAKAHGAESYTKEVGVTAEASAGQEEGRTYGVTVGASQTYSYSGKSFGGVPMTASADTRFPFVWESGVSSEVGATLTFSVSNHCRTNREWAGLDVVEYAFDYSLTLSGFYFCAPLAIIGLGCGYEDAVEEQRAEATVGESTITQRKWTFNLTGTPPEGG